MMLLPSYINYWNSKSWNPQADYNFDQKVTSIDIGGFCRDYAYYWELQGAMRGASGDQLYGDSSFAVLSLNAPALLPNVGERFNITLTVSNVTGLWSWGSSLYWDPNALQLTNVTEGSFLQSMGDTLFLSSIDDSSVANGTLQDIGASLMTSSGVSGSGALATLTFQVVSQQPTNISITGSQLNAIDENLEMQPINHIADNLIIIQSSVTVAEVSPQILFVQQNFTLPINVTLGSLGNDTMPVTMQTYANNTLIGTEYFNITGNGYSNVTINCNITGVAVGNYTISVVVFPSLQSTYGSSLTGSIILVTYAADLTGNFIVNSQDTTAFIVALINYTNYGTYNPRADFDHDGDIDSTDQMLYYAAYQDYFNQH